MRRTKGQIQMGETIAVIFIVVIILFFGIVFWSNVSNSNIREIQSQSNELSVIEMANIISELPELKCSDAGVFEVKCLDLYKINAMNQTIENANYPNRNKMVEFYNNYFKSSRITVVQIYPIEKNTTIYDVETGNTTRTLLIAVPVNVRDPITKVTSYGSIVVEGYYSEK